MMQMLGKDGLMEIEYFSMKSVAPCDFLKTNN